ncbi:MAG: AAA family ATPase [Bacteroidales bacterium]|nr:AAA family ATPase [Bacteroidales bacterium]
MININTQQLMHILDVTPASHNVMLVGNHGIGKSEILTHYYAQRGLRVVPLFLGQMSDPGDLIGLPRETEGRTSFLPPYWFPIDGRPIVLFLDELNRARPEILQTVMDLALNRTLAGHTLPEGSRIISAVNEGEEYQLTQLDPALVSRFNVYRFTPTAQEWLLWAQNENIDPRVIRFIEREPSWLDGTPDQKEGIDTGLEKYPDRRAWRRVSDVIKGRATLVDDDLSLVAGIVGAAASSRFYASCQGRNMLTGVQILNDFADCEAELRQYKLHQMAIVSESMFRYLESAYDMQSTDAMQLEQYQLYASNFKAYYDFLVNTEQRECIAYLANLFESGSYMNAVLFITSMTPEVYQQMADFIANL